MRITVAAAALCVTSTVAATLVIPAVPSAGAATPGPEWVRPAVTFTQQQLEFEVTVGPPSAQETCNVEGVLRIPAGADAAHPAAAILTTNGFGGNENSAGAQGANGSYAVQYARQGYVTLSYSGLGFGNSTCQIELDSPAYDGEAAAALVDFLGGDLSSAYTAFTKDSTGLTPGSWANPVSVAPPVVLDHVDHNGKPSTHDPRVGMIGASYGGEIQFAAADESPKVDAIIPQDTWNDLVYSLSPNNRGVAGQDETASVAQTDAAPGVTKLQWLSELFAAGALQPVGGLPSTSLPPALPPTISSNGGAVTQTDCPDFDSTACTAIVTADTVGYADPTGTAFLHSASVGTYLQNIHIPVFLTQGQDDTLFTLREAITSYEQLKAQGTPVKMLWEQWGHSGPAVPGEADGTSTVPVFPEDLQFSAWFAKYLRDDPAADPGAEFEYLTPWLPANGVANTTASDGTVGGGTGDTSQFTGAASFPVGKAQTLYLSGGTAQGTGDLVSSASQIASGAASFLVSPDTASSTTEVSALSQDIPITDTPGTFAAFSTPPLTADADQVGSPTLTVNLAAPTIAAVQSQPAAALVLFAKLYDVSPAGTVTLANRVITPVRVVDVTKPVTLHLPAIVHRYPAGDHLELVLAAGDAAYKGNNTPGPVQVVSDAQHVNTLSLPLVDTAGAALATTTKAATPTAAKTKAVAKRKTVRAKPARRATQASGTLAYTGISPAVGFGGLALLLGSLLLRRRRKA